MRQNKHKIKILIPIRHPVGGIRTFLKYTHGNLGRDIYEFSFLSSSKEWLTRIQDDFNGYHVHAICAKRENSTLSMLLSMFSLLMRRKCNIIHSQGLTAGMISVIANMIFRRPHVITLHQVFGQGSFADKYFGRYARLKKNLIQAILANADIIQCVSDDARKNLLEFFPGMQKNQHKIITIRNGIDVVRFADNHKFYDEPFKKSVDRFYVGFIGRYMPEKGFLYVIDAVDTMVNELAVKNIRVVCVGGFSAFIREYKREIGKRNISEYFEFLDFFENIAPVLKHIDLLLIPSQAETCPLLPMEALVCGTPIVAFSCIGLREVLQDTPARTLPVGDLKGLVNEVLDIKNSYPGVKKEFDNFMAQARERYDVKTAAAKLNELFRKLAKT
jgi:glycosyltransferase involved in cell wall biosynthesis